MKKTAALVLTLLLAAATTFADSPKSGDAEPAKPAKPAAKKVQPADPAAIAAELDQLRQTLEAQQAEIQQLKEALSKRDRQIGEVRDAAASAGSTASAADAKATEAVAATAGVKTAAASLSTEVSDLRAKVGAKVAQESAEPKEGPASIRIKGITLTPGGFLAAETVFRTRGVSGDINTPFNSIPFPGSSQAKTSEFNATGRQSRFSLLAEGKTDSAKFTGYYEADFLSAGTTSNNNQSNSYSLRQRQVWGQVALNSGWAFTGGQMWSLATETKKHEDNRTEVLPMTIDPQYHVGFGWARQFGFRVTKQFGDTFTLGASVEGPQTTFAAHGNTNNFLIAAPGAGGGLFNSLSNYSFNKTPDFVVKAALDPGWGHYEVFGVISTFRSRVFPCATSSVAVPCSVDSTTVPSAVGAFNSSATGGGIGVNIRVPVVAKKLDAGVHFFGGDGTGRYGSSGLPDATVRPDGTLALIRGGQALGTVEVHATPKFDLYFNFGEEYAFRTAYLNSAGKAVGYGSPLFNNSGCSTETLPANQNTPGSLGGCTADTRNVIEGTVGFWHTPYKGSRGQVRWGIQYSYLTRNAWSGNNNTPTVAGIAPKAVENMVFTSFRYYLP